MTGDSDRLLVQLIRGGGQRSESAWEELVGRYEGRLRAYVRRRLRDHAASDDVVQETFIGFLNSLTNYDDRRDLQTWLFTIASHKVTDQMRKSGRRPYQTGSESDEEQMGRAADEKQRAASSIARSQERVDLEVDAVSRALKEIVRGFQEKGEYARIQVLELLFVKGWPNWQVAEYLSVSEQQVANYRFAAVKKLTEAMRAAGLPDDVFPELKAEG
ncbi:MAG: sigma-70 family RNA polymerase sigma factor [Gemmataceae bacterium]